MTFFAEITFSPESSNLVFENKVFKINNNVFILSLFVFIYRKTNATMVPSQFK